MNRISLAVLALTTLAAGCGHKPGTDEAASTTNATTPPAASPSPTAPAAPAPSPTAFAIDDLPLSNAPLGKFPFFGWPATYVPQNPPKDVGFGHFLFWTGKAFSDVEGQTFLVTLVAAPNRQFSSYELKRNMEALFQQAGAVRVFEGKIPYDTLHALPSGVLGEILPGLGDAFNDPVETWVIRRPHDAVWINYSTNTAEASLAVVQTKPFVPTASLLPPDRLKADLDATGKAVIHVNFATDQVQILPTSSAQMDAVVALLKSDPALRLAINGYTDDTGSDEHNVALSDGRARAVQAALVAAGIKPDRLHAKGYGRMSPVSTNTDEAGKAANRRVELVKL